MQYICKTWKVIYWYLVFNDELCWHRCGWKSWLASFTSTSALVVTSWKNLVILQSTIIIITTKHLIIVMVWWDSVIKCCFFTFYISLHNYISCPSRCCPFMHIYAKRSKHSCRIWKKSFHSLDFWCSGTLVSSTSLSTVRTPWLTSPSTVRR